MDNIIIKQKQEAEYQELLPKSSSSSTKVSIDVSDSFQIPDGSIDDILFYIGKYNQYWWKKEDASFSTQQKSGLEAHEVFTDDFATIYYRDELSLDEHGNLTASPIKSYSGKREEVIKYRNNNLIRKYCSFDKVQYWWKATNFYSSYTSNLYIKGMRYELKNIILSNPIYLQSTNENEYLSGFNNHSFFTKLGIPLKNTPFSSKTEKTYYVGTGVYPTEMSISFSFAPIFVIIFSSYSGKTFLAFPTSGIQGEPYGAAYVYSKICSLKEKSLSFSTVNDNSNYVREMNDAGNTYVYVAFS